MPISEEGREALQEETRLPRAGEDPAREEYVDALANQPSRPLTDEEQEAAEHDHGRPERVYAPASERAPKDPAPGDDRIVHRE